MRFNIFCEASKYPSLMESLKQNAFVFPVGLDYQSCPTSNDCENNPVDSYWKSASIQVIVGQTAGWLSWCGAL